MLIGVLFSWNLTVARLDDLTDFTYGTVDLIIWAM